MTKNLIFNENSLRSRIRNKIGDEFKKVDEEKLEESLDYAIEQLNGEENMEGFYDFLTKVGLKIAAKEYNTLAKNEFKFVKRAFHEKLRELEKEHYESLSTPVPYTTWPGNVGYPLGM